MRPGKDKYWLDILQGIKLRGTCPRRQAASIIIDDNNHLLSSGYNGSPNGIANCIDMPCGGEKDVSGDTSRCIAVHAEQNAIMQAGDRLIRATKIYCTTFPCFICAKLICQTPIKTVIYIDKYPDERAIELFRKASISVVKAG